ncbi:MAG: alpha/beta fold hydrolase [Gammaproteobacteria bacterium]|nr:alpha/beta fold hydrolase [Gammaproteobacteria bacterium]MDH4254184.1 alpha/beta fold hydrolase [Gammaproteobacteria bacterium]MDH5309045.1 alpha/beta fold hydrolase [Gammaproteobacteria bacterium]
MTAQRFITILVVLAATASCAGPPPEPPPRDGSVTTWIESRGTQVPATWIVPDERPAAGSPLVVMAHGHGGSRDEAGAFRRIADELAARGIASIRVDFPGCGESIEPFTANTVDNMLADLAAARRHALADPDIDASRSAILGYSMGGRLALLSLDAAPAWSAAALWAPAAGDGPDAMYAFLGGRGAYLDYRDEAQAAGAVTVLTPWGGEQSLGAGWFPGLEERSPMAPLARYTGPLLVLHGEDDSIVDPAWGAGVAEAAARSTAVSYELLPGADHGLGFYGGDPALGDYVIKTTIDFLVMHLRPE